MEEAQGYARAGKPSLPISAAYYRLRVLPMRAQFNGRIRARFRRSRTLRPAELALAVLADEAQDLPLPDRPRTRGECVDGPRPCPWVSCRHHLFLDVTRAGMLKLNFPDIEPDQLEVSCSLDLADEGTQNLRQIGKAMNITRERVRQIEVKALTRARRLTTKD